MLPQQYQLQNTNRRVTPLSISFVAQIRQTDFETLDELKPQEVIIYSSLKIHSNVLRAMIYFFSKCSSLKNSYRKKPQNTSREKIHEYMGQSAGLLISFSSRKGIKGSPTGTKLSCLTFLYRINHKEL